MVLHITAQNNLLCNGMGGESREAGKGKKQRGRGERPREKNREKRGKRVKEGGNGTGHDEGKEIGNRRKGRER